MAIYHCSAKIISRSKGQSCVASAAYRAGDKLIDHTIDKVFDYGKKQGIVHSEIILPDNAPEILKDRETLWNEVENVEKAKDAQLAREIEVALPKELSQEQQIDLARNYGTYFAQQGMIADLSIHDKSDGNPHCHIMLTMRPINDKGEFGVKSKKVFDLDKEGNRIPVLDKKSGVQKKEKNGKKMWKNHKERSTEWDNPASLQKWRNDWAELANQSLENVGRTERIDCRSLENQNINRAATIHEGYAARLIERNGGVADRCEINRMVKSANVMSLEFETQINILQQTLKNEVMFADSRESDPKQQNTIKIENLRELLYKEALYKARNKTSSQGLRNLKKLIQTQEKICINEKLINPMEFKSERKIATEKAEKTLYNVLSHSQKQLEILYKNQTILRQLDFAILNKTEELKKLSGVESFKQQIEAKILNPVQNELDHTMNKYDLKIKTLQIKKMDIDREITTLEQNEPVFFKGGWRDKLANKNEESKNIRGEINKIEIAKRNIQEREHEKIEQLESKINVYVMEYLKKNPSMQLARQFDHKGVRNKLNEVGKAIVQNEKMIRNITGDNGRKICRLTKESGQAKGNGSSEYKKASSGAVKPFDVSQITNKLDKEVQLIAHLDNEEIEKDWTMMTEIEKDEKLDCLEKLDRY